MKRQIRQLQEGAAITPPYAATPGIPTCFDGQTPGGPCTAHSRRAVVGTGTERLIMLTRLACELAGLPARREASSSVKPTRGAQRS